MLVVVFCGFVVVVILGEELRKEKKDILSKFCLMHALFSAVLSCLLSLILKGGLKIIAEHLRNFPFYFYLEVNSYYLDVNSFTIFLRSSYIYFQLFCPVK